MSWFITYIVLQVLATVSCTAEFHHSVLFKDDQSLKCQELLHAHVTFPGDKGIASRNFSFKLTTRSILNLKINIYSTSKRSSNATSQLPCLYLGTDHQTGDNAFATANNEILEILFEHKESWYNSKKTIISTKTSVAIEIKSSDRESGKAVGRTAYAVQTNKGIEIKYSIPNQISTPNPDQSSRRKRSLRLQSDLHQVSIRKVLELALVLDSRFIENAGGETNAVSRAMQMVNYVNWFYNKLQLQIVLTDLVIWSLDPFYFTDIATDVLRKFTSYKVKHMRNLKYDTIILLSFRSSPWTDDKRIPDVLGLAYRKGLCDSVFSTGIFLDYYPEAIRSAQILTHEIGHNLGFNHIKDIDNCDDCTLSKTCIMNAAVSGKDKRIPVWSTCSVTAWHSQSNNIWRACLTDLPDASYSSSHGAVCGNGIVEAGEQCDCGPEEHCISACCNPHTCLLNPEAECASGACCDIDSCSFRARGHECRSAVGVCDVPETCSGTSEWCPNDDKVADGVECAIGKAYCYNGECRTTDSQCKALFTPDAVTANNLCFYVLNTDGKVYGHCEKQLKSISYELRGIRRNFNFTPCTFSDAKCGLLHCTQDEVPTDGTSVTLSVGKCYARPRLDFSSSRMRSPSFVPDGVKCGEDSMCINSVCTNLTYVRTCSNCSDCNGNGKLTRENTCFCNPGFSPPFCNQTGCGGSIVSPLSCPGASTRTVRRKTSRPTTPKTSPQSTVGSTMVADNSLGHREFTTNPNSDTSETSKLTKESGGGKSKRILIAAPASALILIAFIAIAAITVTVSVRNLHQISAEQGGTR